jgi:diaminopimelate dehydrogenase
VSTRRVSVAVVGLGRLGRACAEGVLASADLALAGVVRRPASEESVLPEPLRGARVATHVRDLARPAVALVCVPPAAATEVARGLLEHGVGVVECARLPAPEVRPHVAALERAALHGRAAAIVGAGWDPGALALLRGLALLLAPRGHTEVRHHAAASLHHTLAARNVPGVRDALCTELRAQGGRTQRYVYVELEPDADPREVAEGIRGDPLFLDEETLVLPVESVAALEEEGQGLTLERLGSAGGLGHQRLLVEARIDVHGAAAQVMVGAARALAGLRPGAHTLLEVPLGALLADRDREAAEER